MKRQKISKIIIVALACLFLIAAIILFIINNKTNEKDNEMVDNADINEISPVADVSIDLNYKDNVEIKNNTKYNNSNEIKGKHYLIHEDKNNNNIYISDIEIYADAKTNKCYFKAKIINDSTSTIEKEKILIHFYDSKENLYAANQYFIEKLKSGETQEISFDDIHDFSNAYSVKILY